MQALPWQFDITRRSVIRLLPRSLCAAADMTYRTVRSAARKPRRSPVNLVRRAACGKLRSANVAEPLDMSDRTAAPGPALAAGPPLMEKGMREGSAKSRIVFRKRAAEFVNGNIGCSSVVSSLFVSVSLLMQ